MAEEGTLAIREDVLKFAGANANTTATAEEYTNVYIKMAEGFVCVSARYDYVTNYASVSAIGKEHLRIATAAYAAMKVIEYDMSGFTSKEEAQTMLDVLFSFVVEGVNLLRDEKFRSFILKGDIS